jgi:glycosyltransferase involved in cell wall biosynthesis
VSLVDVCVPLHDPDPDYLRALLDSLRRQTFRDFAVLISDDSAVPSTAAEALIAAYADDLLIKVHREPAGQGMVHNWNCAVRMGDSPSVVLMGQDDLLVDDALESHLAVFAHSPDVVASGSERAFIGTSGADLHVSVRVNDRTRVYCSSPSYRLDRHKLTYLSLRNGNMLGEPSTVMFRRSAYDAIGGYSTRYAHAVDVDFSLRLAEQGDVVYLARPLARFRRHAGSQTTRNIRSGTTSAERVQLITDHGAVAGLTPDELARCVAAAAVHCLHDLLRGVAQRSPEAVRVNVRLLRQLLGMKLRLRYFVAAVAEALSGRNRDAC